MMIDIEDWNPIKKILMPFIKSAITLQLASIERYHKIEAFIPKRLLKFFQARQERKVFRSRISAYRHTSFTAQFKHVCEAKGGANTITIRTFVGQQSYTLCWLDKRHGLSNQHGVNLLRQRFVTTHKPDLISFAALTQAAIFLLDLANQVEDASAFLDRGIELKGV